MIHASFVSMPRLSRKALVTRFSVQVQHG